MRDRNFLAQDEEGIELPGIESVQEEAVLSLADMARNANRDAHRYQDGHSTAALCVCADRSGQYRR